MGVAWIASCLHNGRCTDPGCLCQCHLEDLPVRLPGGIKDGVMQVKHVHLLCWHARMVRRG